MKTRTLLLISLFLLIFLMSVIYGCSTRYGALTVATTKNIDINMREFEKVEEGVVGESKKPIIIIIPTGNPSIEDAIDEALQKAGGDIMQNVVIYYKWFYFPWVYGYYKFEIKGDVWKLKEKSTSMLTENKLKDAQLVLKAVSRDGNIELIEVESSLKDL